MFQKLHLFLSSGAEKETPTLLGNQWLELALFKGPNRIGVSPPQNGNGSSFQKVGFFNYFRIPDDGQSPQTQWFCVKGLHRKPLKYIFCPSEISVKTMCIS
jgi:hypothetical protein